MVAENPKQQLDKKTCSTYITLSIIIIIYSHGESKEVTRMQ